MRLRDEGPQVFVQAEGTWTNGGALQNQVATELQAYLRQLKELPEPALREEVRILTRRLWRRWGSPKGAEV